MTEYKKVTMKNEEYFVLVCCDRVYVDVNEETGVNQPSIRGVYYWQGQDYVTRRSYWAKGMFLLCYL